MPKLSLRRYDVQAKVGLVISLVAVLALLALTALVFSADKGFRNVDFGEFVINYGQTRKMMVYAACGVTLLLGVIGFGFGLNSAGQRRNDKQRLSWIGFFLGAGVICMALVLLVLFRVRGESAIS